MPSLSKILKQKPSPNGSVRAALPALLLVTGMSLTGCLSTPPIDNLPQAPEHVAPEADEAAELEPYKLQIGDVIDVKLILNPELNDEVAVRPDGKISTSVAQDIPAYGRTASELASALDGIYAQQLRNPHVAVLIRSFAPSRIYVTGEVNTPGEFITVGPNLTMLQAIARAGGIKTSARPDKILIIRRGAGEDPKAYFSSYAAAVTGADPASDVRLATYDVVYVPRSDVADVYLHYQQYFEQFVPISLGVTPGL